MSIETKQYSPFESHFDKVQRRGESGEIKNNRIRPLRLRNLLRAKLDADSPFREASLPSLFISKLDNVCFYSTQHQPIGVTGLINGTWLFTLGLQIDEANEKINVGSLSMNNLADN